MTTDDNGRHRQLEAISVRVDNSGNYHATLEDGTDHPLIVDRTYQRDLDQRKVESIRADWDPIAADPICLSMRDNGDLAIVNGQHEIVAAILEAGGRETDILAEVFNGLSVAREADIRLKKNNAKPDTALEKFHARLKKEEEAPGVATAIMNLLAEFGAFVPRSQNRTSGIGCVGTVERLYRRDDGVVLRRTLRATKEAFGELNGDPVTSSALEGLAWFLTVHQGEYSWKQVIERLRNEGVDGIRDIGRGFKRAMGGADWLNYYRALVEVYNRKRRDARNKLELKTTRWTAEVPAGSLGRTGAEERSKPRRAA